MKKILFSILLISVLCTVSVFAVNGWDLSFTAGYDHHSCNDNSSNAFGMTFGARTQFHKDIDFYGDFSVHAWGDYKFVTASDKIENLSGDNMGFKTHAGLLFNIPVKNTRFDLGMGAGAGFSRSIASKDYGNSKMKYGFTNLGLAIFGIADFKMNGNISIQGEVIPDIYVFYWDTLKTEKQTVISQQSKLGFGLSAKIGVSYSL